MRFSKYLPICPYCKKRLSYLEAWAIHRDGEYSCSRCRFKSDIVFTRRRDHFGVFSIVFSSVLTLLFSLIGEVSLFDIILVLIPFLIFYVLVPFTMHLNKNFEINKNIDGENARRGTKRAVKKGLDMFEREKLKEYKRSEKSKFDNSIGDDMGETRVFDNFYE